MQPGCASRPEATSSRLVEVSRHARWLARLALVGVLFYVAIDVALRFLRPDLSLLHNAESDYGNGPYAWFMDVNFEIRFLLSLACVAALWKELPLHRMGKLGVILVCIWAVSSGILGFFPDDLPGAAPTVHGAVHLLSAAIGFISCLVGTLLLLSEAWQQPLLRPLVPVLAVLWVLALLSLLALGRAGFSPQRLGGLYERVFIGAQLAWLAVIGARLGLGTHHELATR